MKTADLQSAFEDVTKAKSALLAAIKAAGPETVKDWELLGTDGQAVRLSELFGEHDDLLVVHNMGRGCNYCTLWADGFRGYVDHIDRRCAFVLCSDDSPEIVAGHAAARGWNFRCVSGAGTGFARAMGYADEQGNPLPGVSSFHRQASGSIVRTGHMPFGPGDDFCPVWPLFDLLEGGQGAFSVSRIRPLWCASCATK